MIDVEEQFLNGTYMPEILKGEDEMTHPWTVLRQAVPRKDLTVSFITTEC